MRNKVTDIKANVEKMMSFSLGFLTSQFADGAEQSSISSLEFKHLKNAAPLGALK